MDRYIAKDLHLSKKKQGLISSIIHFCDDFKSQLILEGVETEKEAAAAKDLGVSIAQGYLLGKPALLNEFLLLS